MFIQSIGSSYYQAQNPVRSDFQTFKTDAKALQSALSSGNQDQVTLSESALSTALTNLLNDFSSNTKVQSSSAGSSPTQDLMQTFQNDLQNLESQRVSSSGSTQETVLSEFSISMYTQVQSSPGSSDQTQDPMQTLLNDLQTLLSALSSTSNSQDASSSDSPLSTALNNVLNDLSAMKSHGYHHHSTDGNDPDNGIAGTGQIQNTMQAFQNYLQNIESALTADTQNQGDSSSKSTQTMMLSEFYVSMYTQGQSSGADNSNAVNTLA